MKRSLGLQGVGAGAVAALELALVELELLAVGAFLRPRQFDLVLGQQRAGIGFQDPDQQFLALAAEALVGQQRLGHALAVAAEGLVVEQRLLQAEGGDVAVVVAVFLEIAAGGGLGHIGPTAPTVVAVHQARQQRRAAERTVLPAGLVLLDRGLELRVVLQGQVIAVQQAEGEGVLAQQQQEGAEQPGHQAAHGHRSVLRQRHVGAVEQGLNR